MLHYFTYSGTAFFPFRDIYPECLDLIGKEDNLYPLRCMASSCPRDKNCATTLAHRVNFVFEQVVPEVSYLFTYFKHQDRPKTIRAGVFTKDLLEPRVIVCNHFAFKRFMEDGTVYSWNPPADFYTKNRMIT